MLQLITYKLYISYKNFFYRTYVVSAYDRKS